MVTLSGLWSGPTGSRLLVDGTPVECPVEGTWSATVMVPPAGGEITIEVLHQDATLATRVVTVTPTPSGVAWVR